MQDTLRRIGWGESIEHNETVRLRKDGSPVEVSLSISPIKAPSGATIGISKVARDITDSNSTRQALRQQTEERRRIFETSQDLILVTDPEGVPGPGQPEFAKRSWDIEPEEMIGRSGVKFIHPDDLETARDEMRAARRGRQHTEFRYTLHPQGRTHGDAVVDGRMVRAGASGISSSAAT